MKVVFGETIIARTIRLLRENGITDIALSTNDERYEEYELPILHHNNPMVWEGFVWLRAFYPMTEPVCYVYGDVFFSPEAIKTIVDTQTDDIEFFGSARPFSPLYTKKWAEPFAFKVQDTDHFARALQQTLELDAQGRFRRMPISWELWAVIKGTDLNRIDYTNYTVINDYSVDIDSAEQMREITDRGPEIYRGGPRFRPEPALKTGSYS